MILRYAEIFGANGDIEKAERIADFIMTMQDADTGRFVHVLDYPSLEIRDEFRVIYYPGEACYGLLRLYGHTGRAQYLNTVKKAFDFFIEKRYDRFADHWLAYATDELTRHLPEDKYYEFGLRNVFGQLNFISERTTAWPTFLELLSPAIRMADRITEQGRTHLLKELKIESLREVAGTRLRKQLEGVMLPEMSMFFESPEAVLYGVFSRHNDFRMRIDDAAHHLLGCCQYLQGK